MPRPRIQANKVDKGHLAESLLEFNGLVSTLRWQSVMHLELKYNLWS